jgi:hypothetical protein
LERETWASVKLWIVALRRLSYGVYMEFQEQRKMESWCWDKQKMDMWGAKMRFHITITSSSGMTSCSSFLLIYSTWLFLSYYWIILVYHLLILRWYDAHHAPSLLMIIRWDDRDLAILGAMMYYLSQDDWTVW